MPTLKEDLCRRLRGRVCVVGIGNPDRGDDAFGVRLAEAMSALGHPDVILADWTPERWVERLSGAGFETVLFLDAADVGGAPGDVVLLGARDIVARYPQVSTHKLSLGTLARLIETQGTAEVLLLAVQPCSLARGSELSAPVRTTLEILRDLLLGVLINRSEPLAVCGERS